MADISRLPGTNADFWDWQLDGACRGEDPSLFFHPDAERGPARETRERAAKSICSGCPVKVECAAHALAVKEPYGIWGGLSEEDRERIYRQRKASRVTREVSLRDDRDLGSGDRRGFEIVAS